MRNVWILALAQAFAACGVVMLVTFGGIVGTRIAPRAELATLPWSLAVIGTALSTIPAALAMQRFGRKPVFVGGGAAASLAGLVIAWAVAQGDFAALCLGSMLLGVNSSIVQQYRFAATEQVDVARAGQAVSIVMLGTLAAAVLGPEIGTRSKDLGGWPEFTGSFLALAVLCAIGAAIAAAVGAPAPRAIPEQRPARPFAEVARQPVFVVAVLAGVCSYAVMSFIMTATPISMHVHDGLSVVETKNVISAHLLGMYLPSLASGWLVRVLGVSRLIAAGIGCMLACIGLAAFVGHEFVHYFWGLLLLGVGWNFMFVAGTALLTTTYSSAERFKAQGVNDFAIFATQAIVTLLAAPAIVNLGWEGLNLASLPLLALVALGVLWLRRERASRRPGQTSGGTGPRTLTSSSTR